MASAGDVQSTSGTAGGVVNNGQARFRRALLDLPNELLNHIYELALTEPRPITVCPQLRQPGLLAANREIRAAAKGLYYDNNIFIIDVQQCDGAFYVKYCGYLATLGLAIPPKIHLRFDDIANQANLFAFCQHIHVGLQEPTQVRFPNTAISVRNVIVAAFSMAKQDRMLGLDWSALH